MKLITKNHDYYDSMFRTSNHDDKYTFVRETKEGPPLHIKLPNRITCYKHKNKSNIHTYVISHGFIGFCNEIHPFIHVFDNELCTNKFFYTLDTLQHSYPAIFEGKLEYSPPLLYRLSKIKDIVQWMDGKFSTTNTHFRLEIHNVKVEKEILELFRKHQVSYFVYDNNSNQSKLIFYPILKDFEFFKVYDLVTAFQKIEHHQTNDLVKPDLVDVKIPDKLKAESKGFNKWSFRKEPTTT